MRRINKTQRNYMIIGLCTILLIMAVGYSAFASQLRITGTSNISSNFLVKITNITVSDKVGSASDKTDVTTYNDTSATFGVNLISPGDSITYDITIANQGTIDAVLKLITKTDTNNSAILFETSGVYEGDELKAGETATMKVKVTYNSSVTSQPDNLESNLNLSLDYEQTPEGYVPPARPVTTDELKALAVTTGDGLYADENESGRYLYKGSNPNNYVTFNNEEWRIISIESDGTIKILRNELLEYRAFDSTGARTTGYCSKGSAPSNGCNAWSSTANMVGSPAEFTNGSYSGSVDADSEMLTYLNGEYYNGITSDKDKIVNHNFSVGGVVSDNEDLTAQITGENAYKWNGKMGLITASEYIRANSNQSTCGTMKSLNSNTDTCNSTNWMFNGSSFWTLSPRAGNTDFVWGVDYDGYLGRYVAYGSRPFRPALYLTSSIELSGTGTSSDPYKIIDKEL